MHVITNHLHLHPDVSWKPYIALQLHSFATISFFVFISATQAFLMISQYRVPGISMGFVIGQIGLADEIASIFFLGFWGVISDRIGRRKVLIAGYSLSALGLFTLPLGTSWETDMVATRIVFASGTSALASIMTAMLGEVVAPKGLPRASSMMGIMSGVGALVAAYGYLRLGAVTCLRAAYFIVAGICIVIGTIVCILYRSVPPTHATHGARELLQACAEVPSQVKKDPTLGLALLSSYAARTGSIVSSLFISSWFTQYLRLTGECEAVRGPPPLNATTTFCGLSDTRCAAAVNAASSVSGTVQAVALASALFVGLALEKLAPHPRWGVLCAGFVGAISFCCVAAIDDPREKDIYAVAAFMGLSQIAMIISSQVLLVRQMPKDRLGVLSACYSVIGALGVITVSVWGGQLFDEKFFQGPFVITGGAFGIVFIASILTIVFFPVPKDSREDDSIIKSLPTATVDLKNVQVHDDSEAAEHQISKQPQSGSKSKPETSNQA